MRSREPEKKLKNHETLTPMKRIDSILFIFFYELYCKSGQVVTSRYL